MKKIILIPTLLLAGALTSSAVTFSGQALTAITGAVGGSSSYVVVDTTGNGLNFDASSIGVTFALSSFVTGTDDYVIGYNPTTSGFAGNNASGGANFTLDTNGITNGDAFYIVTFGQETTASVTTAGGTLFNTFNAANWLVPGANGDALAFGANFTQLNAQNLSSQTIVPEPSTYATLAGLLALGYVMVRRRK